MKLVACTDCHTQFDVSGLAAGERVVSAGANKLRNGQAVTLDAKPAPGERAEQGKDATGKDA